MDIAQVSAETRKRLYDLMDPDRSIVQKVWNLQPLTEYETFIAKALGYVLEKPKAETFAERVDKELRRWKEAQHQLDVDNKATEIHNNLVRKQRGE